MLISAIAILILGAALGLALRRVLLGIVKLAFALPLMAVAVKGLLFVEPRAGTDDWLAPMLLGAMAMGVVMLVGYRVINNMFVNARRRNAHERVDKEHDGYLL